MTEEPFWYDVVELEDVLLTAPPGCGKTHHLARLVHSLIRRELIVSPREILAITFSTKAKANLQARIAELGNAVVRRRVHVTNFHGLSYRLHRSHASTLGLDPSAELPRPGLLAAHRAAAAKAHGANVYDLQDLIDEAKAGPFDQDETLDRLERIAGNAGVAYEVGLRKANQLDYADAIRHALRLLQIEEVARLYRARFPIVVVDECQDLTRSQYQMAELLSGQALVLAGDRAQGIYGFARADPEWVYGRMLDRRPRQEALDRSYRSAPAVLRVVSAVARELGGTELICAEPGKWPGGGRARTLRFPDTWAEAAELLTLIKSDLHADPKATVGVMARNGWRRRELENAAREAGMTFELWDHPVHRPAVVRLLRKHLANATARHENDSARLDELYLMCFESCGQDDLETIDELNAAFETIDDLIREHPLHQVIADVRTAADSDDGPVSAGLHFLTGHSGKGQQFDHVYVLGLEEDILPDFRAKSSKALREELAVLHVMVSRARRSLTVSSSVDVRRYPDSPWPRSPSRWLEIIEEATRP